MILSLALEGGFWRPLQQLDSLQLPVRASFVCMSDAAACVQAYCYTYSTIWLLKKKVAYPLGLAVFGGYFMGLYISSARHRAWS